MRAKSFQLCPTLCDPMDCSLPGFSVLGILQARILSDLPCLPLGDLPDARIELASLTSLALAGRFFSTQLSSQSNCHIHTRPLEKP